MTNILYRIARGFVPQRANAGLCFHVNRSGIKKLSLRRWFREWEFYSGSTHYPVPDPEGGGPNIIYQVLNNLYEGKYGMLRRDLAYFLYKKLRQEELKEQYSFVLEGFSGVKRDQLELLLDIALGIRTPRNALCYALELCGKYVDLFDVARSWEFFTGNWAYPIPDPEGGSPGERWNAAWQSKTFYEGKYGMLRRDLAFHLLKHREEW